METTTQQYKKQSEQLTRAYTENHTLLRRYALLHANNSALADDLVQETFLKTWRFIVRGGDIQTMSAFLYHVLNDLIVDEYRKMKPLSLDTLLQKRFEPAHDNRERHANMSDASALVPLLHKLPPNYRQILRMRFLQELSLVEISSLTGKTKNTIAVLIHRGLYKLRALYLIFANQSATD